LNFLLCFVFFFFSFWWAFKWKVNVFSRRLILPFQTTKKKEPQKRKALTTQSSGSGSALFSGQNFNSNFPFFFFLDRTE